MDRYRELPVVKDNGTEHYNATLFPEVKMQDTDIYVISTEGDRWDKLSRTFYGNVDYWWIIATANPHIKISGMSVEPGLQIRIPSNPEQTYQDYINLNK